MGYAMRPFRKKTLPLSQIRRFLEPGPIVLVSSAYRDEVNIMTTGWHMVMGFEPSLVGCYIRDENHSFEMIRKSRECVINIPTIDLAAEVVGIDNSSGRDVDKFAKFGPAAVRGDGCTSSAIPLRRRHVEAERHHMRRELAQNSRQRRRQRLTRSCC